MKRTLLHAILAGCVLAAAGCTRSSDDRLPSDFQKVLGASLPNGANVKYSDLHPETTATVSGNTVIVHLGSDLRNSACWTRPVVKVRGRTVYLSGHRTLREQSRELIVRLPASKDSQPVAIIWINPDGRFVSIPITK